MEEVEWLLRRELVYLVAKLLIFAASACLCCLTELVEVEEAELIVLFRTCFAWLETVFFMKFGT